MAARMLATLAFFRKFLFIICLTNLTSLLQLYWYEGRSLSQAGCIMLLLTGCLRVAGLSFLLTTVCGFLHTGCVGAGRSQYLFAFR